jgi:transketolase
MTTANATEQLDEAQLVDLARQVRRDVIDILWHSKAGHPGGSLSAVEILVALYFKLLRIDPAHPLWEERDRFVLSKGHASAAYYAVLQRRGFFPAELLQTYDKIDSCLQAHPDCHTPGVDMPSGSLGMGLSAGVGFALGARLRGFDSRVYVLVGDGEQQEGQIWEAAMAAPKFRLGNLTAIIDANRIQLMGDTQDIMPVEPVPDKWRAFNWNVLEADGHSIAAIVAACKEAATLPETPTVIIAHTTKGKGVSFMENTHTWHTGLITDELRAKALAELEGGEA